MKSTILTLGLICLSLSLRAQYTDSLSVALGLIGLTFDQAALDSMQDDLRDQAESYRSLRAQPLPNDLPLSLAFMPPLNLSRLPVQQTPITWDLPEEISVPTDREALAFLPVHQLAVLIKNRKVSSLELTQLYLARLRRFGDTLQCVITLTDSLALAQARRADAELAEGIYRGPLHGIPYGVKDLLAVEGYPTTWGARPYQNQRLAYTATVVRKLEEAGAVCVAKLTLGALAWGDIWYGGVTKNPWNLTQGSSGSSAGSASATVAGLVPFAIGSETWGSIVSPSTRCGATGLRPTFGRVSRHGAMALSWTMDKLGPICRHALDCALVLDVIRGGDGLDLTVRDLPFNYQPDLDPRGLRVGILRTAFDPEGYNYANDSALIARLEAEGITLIDKTLPDELPVDALAFILSAEAGTAFDELTRSGRDSLLVRQMKNAWPTVFRASRLIPAVEYLQANRLRHLLTQQMNTMLADVDALIAPSFSDQLLITNLTGHPCVVLPDGSYAEGTPGSITLLGNHFEEGNILRFAAYVQSLTPFEEEHPAFFR